MSTGSTNTGTTQAGTTNGEPTPVKVYFDVTCPFAWVTSRWLKEVEKVRNVDITWAPMSLSVLNEGRDLGENYNKMMDLAWVPARLSAAVWVEYPEKLDAYYTAVGTKIHNEKRVDEENPTGYKDLLVEALEEVGLPADLLDAAEKKQGEEGSYEPQLRKSHEEGISLVGNEVGTPVVKLGDRAFFGPVLTRIPQGEQAGQLFDAAVTLGLYPHFFELKRSRTESPEAVAAESDRD